MEPLISEFKLAERSIEVDGTRKHFTDCIIDGESLNDRMNRVYPHTPPHSTELRDDFDKAYGIDFIKRLLGEVPPNLATGRSAIYVCAVDGDLACGALGCFIDFTDTAVVWRDFAWDDNGFDEAGSDLEESLQKYTFDRQRYESALRDELARLQ